MSILYFDGMLGLHIVFALIWVVTSFISVSALMRVSKRPADVASAKRAKTLQTIKAASGGLTVLIGAGFYYYINFYRTSYATSSTGLPLVDAGAALGLIAFAWQIVQGSRISKSLNATIASTSGSSGVAAATVQTASASTLPKSLMLISPAILLLLAIILMIGGTMM